MIKVQTGVLESDSNAFCGATFPNAERYGCVPDVTTSIGFELGVTAEQRANILDAMFDPAQHSHRAFMELARDTDISRPDWEASDMTNALRTGKAHLSLLEMVSNRLKTVLSRALGV